MDAIRALLGTRSSTTSASPTAPSSARPTRASSRTTTGRWCSTARSTPNSYINKPDAGPARAVGRLRARTRPLLPGLRRGQGHCPFGGPDPFAAYDALIAQANMLAIPANGYTDDPRPVNGDDILNGTLITLYNKGNWPLLAGASPRRARATRRPCGSSPMPPGGTTSTARSTRAPTATSRSAPSSRSTRATSVTSSRPATTRGACSSTSGSTRLRRDHLRALADPRQGRVRRSVHRVEVGTDGARGRDDL